MKNLYLYFLLVFDLVTDSCADFKMINMLHS